MEHMHHGALGFISDAFKRSQLGWPTVDREVLAVVSTFRRLAYFLWNGAVILCDHRNLAYILCHGATGATISKTVAQRLQGWGAYIGQFNYKVVHIPGARNSLGDMLLWMAQMDRGTPDAMGRASVSFTY